MGLFGFDCRCPSISSLAVRRHTTRVYVGVGGGDGGGDVSIPPPRGTGMRSRKLVVGNEAVLLRSLVSNFSEARLSRLLRSVAFMVQTYEKFRVC